MKNHLETDLKKIKQLANKQEKENLDFRIFLKGEDSKKVDRMIHRLDKEIGSKVDCTSCANCCKSLYITLTNNDVDRLAHIKSLNTKNFKSKYVEEDNFDGDFNLKHKPCIFLSDKLCNIYEQRPETCQSYPHLHKNGMVSRSLSMLDNYQYCPIVFNVVEELKKELKYRF
jgi:Fe-S-cluster containining protein